MASAALYDTRIIGVSFKPSSTWSFYSPRHESCESNQYDPLIQPALIKHEIPLSPESQETIKNARLAAAEILAGRDDRLLVIVGPCSIHSPELALDYAKRLKELAPSLDGLFIIMRSYL